GDAENRRRSEKDYGAFLREKVQGQWFAALLSTEAGQSCSVQRRFESWKTLLDFLIEREALVEVWAYPQKGGKPRRIPATQLAALKKERREQPTFTTATYRDSATAVPATYRIEFNFKAASDVMAASAGYQRQREMQLAAREVLGVRDAEDKFNALTQWEQLNKAGQAGRLTLAEMPPKPANPRDLFVAFEYEVDSFNNYSKAVRVYRESEITHHVVEVSKEQ